MVKQTKKELKALFKEREKDLKYLNEGYKDDEKYKLFLEKISEFNKELRSIRADWWQEHKEARDACSNELKAIKKVITYKGELDPKDYDKDVQKAYNLFYRGTSEYQNRKLIWVSNDQRFCVLKMPSTTGYVDRMSGSKSSPSEWFLVDVEIFKGGWSGSDEGVFYHREGGRWSKKFETLIKEEVQKYIFENLL